MILSKTGTDADSPADAAKAPAGTRWSAFEAAAAASPASIWIARQGLNGDRAAAPDPEAASGPLAGLLAAAKDNIDVAGFATTAACPDFAYQPTRSAGAVERAMAAGATFVGKTNLDQFACGLVGTRSPYGAVPNAFNPDYVSGGSSSGSAIAVALGLVDFSFGTDTAGSGRVPAGFNNIVGIKPTRGLISARGVLPACQHIDCVSIFARTVPQAVNVLLACAGYDPEDPFSRRVALDPAWFPERLRIGVPDAARLNFFGDRLAQAAFGRALEQLRELSAHQDAPARAEIVEIDYQPLLTAASRLYEGPWLAERYAAVRDFFDRSPDSVDPAVRTILEGARRYSAADLFQAMVEMGAWRQQAAALWERIDVMVVPTAPTIYTIAQVQADPIALNRNLGYYTNFVNLLDLAAIAVPASIRPDGLPFGITLIGPAGSDLRLADLAQRFHVATGLPQANTREPLPAPVDLPRAAGSTVRVAVVGAHLSGLPLNSQLTNRGARKVATTRTASCYRFYALPGTTPPKPGLVRVAEDGVAIEAEIWEMPLAEYGSFVALIPAPLGIGSLALEDGSSVQGFLCEASALAGARDISGYGGWRAYLASLV